MNSIVSRLALAATAAIAFGSSAAPTAPDPALVAAVADPGRTASFVARDPARHPAQELAVFGTNPAMTVVELWPGGGYWTEILGPYLAKGGGTYYVALNAPGDAEEDKGVERWRTRMTAEKDRLGTIHETVLGAGHFEIAPAGSADLVVTFRNLHNWMDGGYADQALAAAFKALKPGGILGIEEHRGRNDKPQDPRLCRRSGEEGRFRAGRLVGNQRESEGHQGLGGWRVDAAARALAGRQGSGQISCRRRSGQLRVEVPEAPSLGAPALGRMPAASSRLPLGAPGVSLARPVRFPGR
jgi:predicted methyltransferase